MSKPIPYRIFTLHIGGVLPTKMRVEVLGVYLQDFARLLGPEIDARFHSVKKGGSSDIAVRIRPDQEQDVKNRAYLINTDQAPPEAQAAKTKFIDDLARYQARGAALFDPSSIKIIEFPAAPVPEMFKPIPTLVKSGSVQGQVVGIRKKSETVSVLIEDVDGYVYGCTANRDIARALGRYIFGKVVRAFGTGKWKRGEDGNWKVEDFQIASFDETLNDAPFSDAIAAIRGIDAEWKHLEPPP